MDRNTKPGEAVAPVLAVLLGRGISNVLLFTDTRPCAGWPRRGGNYFGHGSCRLADLRQ
jgi:hypothetical protein